MEDFKEFQGKSLDEAIQGACKYYNTPREKLEIEIVQDAKNGIFGLVGVRKALIRARRAHLRTSVGTILGRDAPEANALKPSVQSTSVSSTSGSSSQSEPANTQSAPVQGTVAVREQSAMAVREQSHVALREQDVLGRDRERPQDSRGNRAENGSGRREGRPENRRQNPPRDNAFKDSTPRDNFSKDRSRAANSSEASTDEGAARRKRRPSRSAPRSAETLTESPAASAAQDVRATSVQAASPASPTPAPRQEVQPSEQVQSVPTSLVPADAFAELDQDDGGEELAVVPFTELDGARLQEVTRNTALQLINPILGEVPVTVALGPGRVEVHIECGDDSGLLIGREGQTLAALQYLASRIVSRAMTASVRVQIDVGDYRERQDERLRDLALSLAERVRNTGRSCSTRPMSSYHRRIVHLALQEAPDVQTRSSGEGPLKRVIVQRRRQQEKKPV